MICRGSGLGYRGSRPVERTILHMEVIRDLEYPKCLGT